MRFIIEIEPSNEISDLPYEWHVWDIWGGEPIDRGYHKTPSDCAEIIGIFLGNYIRREKDDSR